MMKTVHGDLVEMAWEGYFDTIVHGCNCMGIMGAGIARQIADKFPEAAKVDRRAYTEGRALPSHASFAIVQNKNLRPFRIINAYTQFYPGVVNSAGWDTPRQRLGWIEKVFENISAITGQRERIGIPMIGAGLAGGNWDDISKVIDEQMSEHKNLTLVLYKPKR